MTIKEKIAELMKENPDTAYTSKELTDLTGGKISNIRKALLELVEDGFATKNRDPVTPKNPKYRKTPLLSHHCGTTLTPPWHHCDPTRPQNLYKHITNKEINLLSRKTFPDLEKFHAFVEAYLTPSERKIIESAPDEVKVVFATLLERLQSPVIRTPVLETPAFDPSREAPPRPDGVTEPRPEQDPVPTPEAEAEEVPPLVLKAKQNMEKIAPKSTAKKTPETARQKEHRKALEKALEAKEEVIATSPFHPHVRYYGMTPMERDYEFAKAFVKVMPRMYPDWRSAASYKFVLASATRFRESKDFKDQARKGRIEADLISARYEDYVMAICQYYMWRAEHDPKAGKPALRNIAGDVHATEAKNRIDDWSPKGQVLITRADIEFSGHADFLLAEKYPTLTPGQKELAHIFLQDVVHDELVRAARLTIHASGKPIWNLFNAAIKYGLVPRQWAEAPATQATLPSLKGYRFEEPRVYDPTIFRPTRY